MNDKEFFYASFILIGTFISSAAQVLLKKVAMKEHCSVKDEYLNKNVIIAYITFVLATFLSIYAYKGIPLSVAATMALSELYGADIRYSSNRKEIKDHGDKGILLGSKLKDGDRVVLIEDVTTAGTSIRETMPLLKAQADAEVLGLIVSVDRMERGQGEKGALQEIGETYGMKTCAIVTMQEVIDCLYGKEYNGRVVIDDRMMDSINAYYEKWGFR